MATVAERLIVALDTPDVPLARELIHTLGHLGVRFKVGPQLFLRAGADWVDKVSRQGTQIFLDMKFHDIPSTVKVACHNAASMGVWMCNVHALGGSRMITHAREGLDLGAAERRVPRPKLLAVTLLTSHDEETLLEIGITGPARDNAVRMARLAQQSGADGVVASAQEAAAIREATGPDFLIVTPGIRPEGADPNDQTRIATPANALRAGASHLVVGRPIRSASKPAVATRLILKEMEKALG